MMKKMLPLSIILNLLFILAFFLLVYKMGGWSHLIYKVKNKGLAGTHQHRTEHLETLKTNSDDIIFLGNSLTQFCEWSELFQNRNIKNRGIAGDGVEGVLKRLPKILQGKPKAIFLMIGVNDLFFHKSDFVLNHYEKILQQCNYVSPNTKVMVQSILPVNEEIKYNPLDNKVIVDLNEKIKALSNKFQLEYVDLHTAFANSEGKLKKDYSEDGIHLNAKGYSLWRDLIKAQYDL